jgi:hypothetical protein
VDHHARVATEDAVDHGRAEGGRHRDRGADAHFAGRRVGEKFDVLHGLAQFVEHHQAAIEQRAPVDRRLDALRRAIEHAHTERVLEIGDRLRHHGVRDRKRARGLRHVSALHHREQDVQVAQLEPAPDTAAPVHARLR